MNVLFDTCSFVWFYSDPTKLSARAAAILQDPANDLALSVVTVWELIVKDRIGRPLIAGDIGQIVADQIQSNNIRLLPLRLNHVLEGRTLPLHHHDPFDRLLVCQALAEGLTLVTPDRHIQKYAVPTEW